MSGTRYRMPAAGSAGHRQGLILVALAALLWATVGMAQRFIAVAPALDPAVLGLLRTLLGGVTLLAVAFWFKGGKPQSANLPLAGIAAFAIGGAVFQVTLFQGFQTVGVAVTAAVTIILPPVLLAGAEAVSRNSLAPGTAAAIGVAALGTVLALDEHGQGPSAPVSLLHAGLLYLVNAGGFLCMVMGLRRMQGAMGSIRAAGTGLIGVAGLLLAFVLVSSGPQPLLALSAPQPQGWALIAYMGVLATGGAYAAFALGLALCRSPAAALAAAMIETVFAAMLAIAVLGEVLSATAASGCALLLLAMVLLYLTARAPTAARGE